MHLHTAIITSTLATSLLAVPCLADVTLTSPDGRWVATIEDAGGAAGQCNGMKDMSLAPAYQSFVANTRHYIRMGSPILFSEYTTERVENRFSLVRFVADSSTYTAVLVSNDFSGTVLMINGEMVSGAQGGLRVALTFMDVSPNASALLQTGVQTFVYANMNVDGEMTGNVGGWIGGSPNGHFWQKRNGSPAGSERWFVGAGVQAIQAMSDSLMQQYLDNGATGLSNQVFTGPGDVNTAIEFAPKNINDAAQTVRYGLGNVNLFVAPTFGDAPNFGLAALFSSDSRWRANVYTSFASVGELAGQVQTVHDQNLPTPASKVTDTIWQYYAADPQGTASPTPFSANATGMYMWITPNSSRASAILRLGTPGMFAIVDNAMLPGESGGFACCTTIVDTSGSGKILRTWLGSDPDLAGFTPNEAGLDGDHIWITAPDDTFGSVRWYRPTSIDSYQISPIGAVWTSILLNQGLNNTVTPGIYDLEWGTGFAPHTLTHNVPFVSGFVVGNPNIAMPSWFCQPTQTNPCLGDLNSDGTVDAADLSVLLGAWGPWQPTAPDTDFNDDGVTDAADLSVLLGAWGSCD
jgi:hypothetical protein